MSPFFRTSGSATGAFSRYEAGCTRLRLRALAAAAGLLVRLWREKGDSRGVCPRGILRVLLARALLHELTFSVLGLSSGAGWYVYAVVVSEALLATSA